jgi:hypothetical protein
MRVENKKRQVGDERSALINYAFIFKRETLFFGEQKMQKVNEWNPPESCFSDLSRCQK